MKLSEAGYGSVNEIEKWHPRKVLQAMHWLNFKSDFEAAYLHMNRKEVEK